LCPIKLIVSANIFVCFTLRFFAWWGAVDAVAKGGGCGLVYVSVGEGL